MKQAGRFRTFLSELRRRHVFRVASIYLVAAWVVVQVAATVGPILDLSIDLPKYVLVAVVFGFPVAIILAWAFDVTAQGLERTDDPDGEPTVIRGRWIRPVVAFVTIMLLFGGAYFSWLRVTRPAVEKGTAIAVFPFDAGNAAELAYLQEGMVHLLGAKLDGAGTLRSVDADVLLKAVAALGEGELTTDAARRIAQRFGAEAFIMGEISEISGTITLSGTLYPVAEVDAPPTPASATGTEADLFTIVDNLAKSLITAQFNVPANRLLRTAGLTTSSLPALKAYLNGEADYRGARWRNAMDWYQRALVEDSAFALASYRLADAAEWAADFDVVIPAAAQAYRNREQLSRRDRALVEALNDWVNGRIETADSAYRQITTSYPDEVEAWYRLGEIQYHYNALRGRSVTGAKPAFERAVSLSPGQEPILLHLTEIALYGGDYAAFDSIMAMVKLEGGAAVRRHALRVFATKDARAIDSMMTQLRTASDGTLSFVANGLAQYSHDIDNAERVALLLTSAERPGPVRGSAYLLLAQLDVARGRWRSALARFAELEKIHRPSALEHHALFAAAPFFRVSPTEMRTVRADLEKWNAAAEPDVESYSAFLAVNNGAHAAIRSYSIGLLSAALKESDAAESQAEMLRGGSDTSAIGRLSQRLSAGVLAYNDWQRGQAAPALDRIRDMKIDASLDPITHSPFYSHAHERFMQAELRYQLGEYREALPWFASIVEGHTELYLLGPSYLRRAQIYDRIGETRLAQQNYRAFVALWEKSDPEFKAILDDARSRITNQTALK